MYHDFYPKIHRPNKSHRLKSIDQTNDRRMGTNFNRHSDEWGTVCSYSYFAKSSHWVLTRRIFDCVERTTAEVKTHSPTWVVLMIFKSFVQRIEKHFIGDVPNQLTCFVQVAENSCSWLFNQITNDFVIEIIHLNLSHRMNVLKTDGQYEHVPKRYFHFRILPVPASKPNWWIIVATFHCNN